MNFICKYNKAHLEKKLKNYNKLRNDTLNNYFTAFKLQYVLLKQ